MPSPSRFRRALAACLALSLATAASPHGSVALEDDLCAIQIGYLKAHFKIYLPRERGHDQFCEDIPATGESVFVMEYIHRGLGEIPIDFRIIRNVTGLGSFARWDDVEALGDLDQITELYLPPAVVADVFTVMHRFDEPGEFIGVVTAAAPNGAAPYTAVFPFEVGFTGFGYWPLIVLLVIALQLNYMFMRGWLGRRKNLRPVAMILALFCVAPTVGAETTHWPSRDGLYRISYSSELDPIAINQLHSWTLLLETAAGEPVEEASLEVGGGMPEHDHGLPTSARVTSALGDGRYLLEGMRFHMNGYWQLTITIDAAPGRDTVVIRLDL